MNKNELIEFTLALFQKASHAADAAKFKAYMKENFEFYGVRSPERKQLQKEIKVQLKNMEADEVFSFGEALWKLPQRELHYVAIDMIVSRAKNYDATYLPRIEKLITTNSWWDSVDALALNVAGLVFKRIPEVKLEWIERWNNSDNMWLNRSAIIHQLRYKEDIDLDLLFALVESHIGSKEFFINKACGWSLRQASKFYPAEIGSFIENHPQLSNLTKREGSKYL